MLSRTLLTAAFLAVATTAVAVVDCTTSYVGLLDDESCSTVSFLGGTSGLWTGVGLGAFALLGLSGTWIPFMRERARLWRHEPVKALVENLGRLADVGSHISEVEEEPNLVEIYVVARLVRRVEAVEIAVTSEKVPSREATQQWVGLLKEANDMHNDGLLDTDDFKKINTRLLDLFTVPKSNAGQISDGS